MPDIIDFQFLKNRRTFAEIDADQARWEDVRDRLAEVMATAELSDIGLTSATLNALLQNITAGDILLDDAKALIAQSLKAFRK